MSLYVLHRNINIPFNWFMFLCVFIVVVCYISTTFFCLTIIRLFKISKLSKRPSKPPSYMAQPNKTLVNYGPNPIPYGRLRSQLRLKSVMFPWQSVWLDLGWVPTNYLRRGLDWPLIRSNHPSWNPKHTNSLLWGASKCSSTHDS